MAPAPIELVEIDAPAAALAAGHHEDTSRRLRRRWPSAPMTMTVSIRESLIGTVLFSCPYACAMVA